MKPLQINKITPILFTLFSFTFFTLISCNNSDDNFDNSSVVDETNGLIKVQEFSDTNYTFSIYTKTGTFKVGYNEIFLQIKNNTTGEYETSAEVSWFPLMHMPSKEHSSPYSSIEKVSNKHTLYQGFIIFQMASNTTEYWSLSLAYQINNINSEISNTINVENSEKRTLQSFTGSDNINYLLTLIEPSSPSVGSNLITAYLFKMEDMNTFTPVNDYTIILDPRMPSMGNHSSPNNSPLTYTEIAGNYKGLMNLTMTSYWKINLLVKNNYSNIIKGEEITESNESSSIFWEIEF